MKASFYKGAPEFLSCVNQLLSGNEARYGLITGIVKRLVNNPHFYSSDDPWFCIVRDETEIFAAAIRTPPFRVLLAYFSGNPVAAAKLLVDAVPGLSSAIPGIVGDLEITDPFAQQWCVRNHVHIDGTQEQRIYQLDRVNAVNGAPGHLRLASLAEKELLARWQLLSSEDIYGAANLKIPVMDIKPAIERNDVYLWEDNIPVSMAARTRPTDNGITVSLVYTPPEFRRRGYATSCVSALCTELLGSGYKFCTLYTDLANPISNSIYKIIGFKEISDSVEYSFSEPLRQST
jgi:uncharacterized protein